MSPFNKGAARKGGGFMNWANEQLNPPAPPLLKGVNTSLFKMKKYFIMKS